MNNFFKEKILYNLAVSNFWKLINYYQIQQFVYKNFVLENWFLMVSAVIEFTFKNSGVVKFWMTVSFIIILTTLILFLKNINFSLSLITSTTYNYYYITIYYYYNYFWADKSSLNTGTFFIPKGVFVTF